MDDKEIISILKRLMAEASDDDYRYIYKMALLAFLCDRNGHEKVMNLATEIRKRFRAAA